MIRPRELSRALSLFPARTPTLPPATHTNSFALGGRDVLLVEPATPYESEQREWIAWARALESQGRKLVGIVATHHHGDHVGGLDVLSRELGLPVWAHSITAAHVGRHLVRRELEDGETIVLDGPEPERWRVLHTPGHDWGHVCLFGEEARAVVVGDMVASVGTILIAPGDGDMRVYLEQLERLAQLGARVALPAHGDPIDEPAKLFRRYVVHRLMREKKVLAALARLDLALGSTGGATAEELVPTAYDDTPPHVWPLALQSLRAHLEKLVGDGVVVERDGRFSRRHRDVRRAEDELPAIEPV
jgi:glyoxylase-like metal-dependent hydrolase (beta-lactamase superfamily II)